MELCLYNISHTHCSSLSLSLFAGSTESESPEERAVRVPGTDEERDGAVCELQETGDQETEVHTVCLSSDGLLLLFPVCKLVFSLHCMFV